MTIITKTGAERVIAKLQQQPLEEAAVASDLFASDGSRKCSSGEHAKRVKIIEDMGPRRRRRRRSASWRTAPR